MVRVANVIGSTVLAMLMAVVESAGQVDDRVRTVETAASANASTLEGKSYEDKVGKAFGRDQSASVQQCAKSSSKVALSDFDLFLRVNTDGVVEDVLVRPASTLSTCVQGRLAKWRVPAPARPDYWVKIAVRLRPR